MKNKDDSDENAIELQEFFVKDLFGKYTYNIPLSKERITIIHGLNGSGKTTIFRILNSFFRADFSYFPMIPFNFFELKFTQKKIVRVYGNRFYFDKNCIEHKNIQHIINVSDLDRKETIGNILNERLKSGPVIELQNIAKDGDRRVFQYKWYDVFEEICKESENFDIPTEKTEQKKFLKKINTIFSNFEKEHINDLWELNCQHPQVLHERMNQDFESDLSPQVLPDAIREFIDNFGTTKSAAISGENSLKTGSKLKKIWFIETQRMFNLNSERDISSRLKTISEDLDARFNDARTKTFKHNLIYFQTIVEEFLDKEMNVGFNIFCFSDKKNPNSSINAEQLSSGERHLIVMFYDLIFRIPDGSLVLIDEPELSLHISWQKKYVSTLKRILELENKKNIEIIIATHSPQIINGRWDLTVGLGARE